MVVKIQKSHKVMNGTLVYNENKVRKGVAAIIGFGGMYKPEPAFARMAFGRLERANIRTEGVSFQMSINPNPDKVTEALTDEEANNYARDIMKSLGYENQPYIIYKHFDIDRVHYHVVSCRVNLQGKKINDKFEKKRVEKLIFRLADKYHYTVGNPQKKSNKKTKSGEKQPLLYNTITEIEPIPIDMGPISMEPAPVYEGYESGEIIPIQAITENESLTKSIQELKSDKIKFNPRGLNVKKQYEQIFDEAMTYRFLTVAQFKAICESMGVAVNVYVNKNGQHLSFQGMNENGELVKSPCNEKTLKREYYKELELSINKNDSKEEKAALKASSKPDRARIGRLVAFALTVSKSQRHFEKILQKKGVFVSYSFNMLNDLFGVTIVDTKTKSAYKSSDLLPPLNIQDVKEKSEIWMTEKELNENRKKLREQVKRDDFLQTIDKTKVTEESKNYAKEAKITWIDILNEAVKTPNNIRNRTINKKKY